MPYEKAKIYTDGSHYIAIPHEEHPERRRTRATVADDKKVAFETVFNENKSKNKKERNSTILDEMEKHFKTKEQAEEFVTQNLERKTRNLIAKRVRLMRKVNQQEWHYFATFTYDDKKHNEVTFRRSLSNCLKHLSSRKGWKYVGVWERSPEKQRLHFHCLLYIPDGAEMGELVEKSDYDTISHKRQITYQNTYFNKRYGRTDFKPICKQDIGNTVHYLTKYMEKTGARIVYSRNLPQYFISDIMDKDIICEIGVDDRKLILSDYFDCYVDGEYIGQVSPEIIAKMPKSN